MAGWTDAKGESSIDAVGGERLGELLVADGKITSAQLEQALRAQVMWGGRLGTNLVDLNLIDLDTLAKALGQQRRMAPALQHHFESADRELQRRLPADVADRLACIPLHHLVRDRQRIAIAAIEPLNAWGLSAVADALGIEPAHVVPAIAGELRIRYQLERVYGIARAARFLRSHGQTIPPFPDFEIEIDVDDAPRARTAPTPARTAPPPRRHDPRPRAVIDDLVLDVSPTIDAAPAPQRPAAGAERRNYVRTLADALFAGAKQTTPAAAGAAVAAASGASARGPRIDTLPAPVLDELARAIRGAGDRDDIARLALDALSQHVACDGAIVLVVRGEVAVGWKGFRGGGRAVPPDLAVPMSDREGLVPRAIESKTIQHGARGALGRVDRRLADALGGSELLVVPVPIAGQVPCAIAVASGAGIAPGPVEAIAKAAGKGFTRLVRNATR